MQAVPFNINVEIESLIGIEGGYVNNPHDSGGKTRWGITEAVARLYGYRGVMEDLPREFAVEVFTQEYFLKPKLDLLYELSHLVGQEVFDTGVNTGPGRAIEFLQQSLNALNRRAELYPDIKVDGICGEGTARALKSFLGERGGEGEEVLLKCLNCLQGSYYLDLTARREKDEEFLYGWVNKRVKI